MKKFEGRVGNLLSNSVVLEKIRRRPTQPDDKD